MEASRRSPAGSSASFPRSLILVQPAFRLLPLVALSLGTSSVVASPFAEGAAPVRSAPAPTSGAGETGSPTAGALGTPSWTFVEATAEAGLG
ncbi:MAG: hypothetical protein MI919_09525, partial [Holophagales bacterium]|nr:hypothetical protein [Holophagales bacterium]